MDQLPRLRAVEVTPFEQDGQLMLLLRDRLVLSGKIVAVPQALGPALGCTPLEINTTNPGRFPFSVPKP